MNPDQCPTAPSGSGDRPSLPPGLVGCPRDGGRVRTLPVRLFHRSTPASALAVAGYLDNSGSIDDPCRWDSTRRMAQATGFSVRAVELALEWLDDAGYVKRDRQRFRNRMRAVWWLLWRLPEDWSHFAIEGIDDAPEPAESTTRPTTTRPRPRVASAPSATDGARACATDRARACATDNEAPCADEAPCAQPAQAASDPLLLESLLHPENVTTTLRPDARAEGSREEPPPAPTDAEAAEQERIARDRRQPTLVRRVAAGQLAAWGRCPAELAELVRVEPAAGSPRPEPPRPTPTTAELIRRLSAPTGPEAVRAVAERAARDLRDLNSIEWHDRFWSDVAAGAFPADVAAGLFTEAKQQSAKSPGCHFGQAVKRWRKRADRMEKPGGGPLGKDPRPPVPELARR